MTDQTNFPIDPEAIARAAALILAGELVAFPTETVYGLGANAFDARAAARIFAAKNRPATSPLIVHVSDIRMAREVVREWPPDARSLAARFWPGPLTLVLPKRDAIPSCVTAGLDTVGVRIPAHPAALALIRQAGVPIAGPSANPFTRLSPTTAAHVRDLLGDRVAFVLDGGPSAIGLESTVLSLAGSHPTILRPGMISRAALEASIGPVRVASGASAEAHPSPGMHARHYSPATPLLLAADGLVPDAGRGAYLWWETPAAAERNLRMPANPAAYAAALYRTLHELDREGWDWIAVELPPPGPEWAAIHDRLQRAATHLLRNRRHL